MDHMEKMRGAQQEISTGRDVEISYRQQIEYEVQRLEAALNKKKEMLKLLNENPAIEKFMNLSR